MSIMQRLVFSQIVVLISLLVIGGGGLLQLNSSHDRFNYLLDNTMPSLSVINRSQRALDEQRIVLHKAMLETDTAKLTTLEAEEHKAAAEMKAALDEYEKSMISDDTDRQLHGEARRTAHELEAKRDDAQRHGQPMGLAVIFLQIAILLSSVAGLFKRRELWLCALPLGLIGLVLFANGFLLFLPPLL